MGLIDNLRGLFSSSKNTPSVQVNDEYEKERLAKRIVDLVDRIKRINSFDTSVWNLSNVSSYELQRKSLEKLKLLKHYSMKKDMLRAQGTHCLIMFGMFK